MALRVFISYRRSDQPLAAVLLYSLLIEVLPKQNVFLDTEKLKLGEPFPPRIMRALSTSDIVFVVVGPDWAGKPTANFPSRLFDPLDFVRKEIMIATELGKRIVPLFVGEARLDSRVIPKELSSLTDVQGFFIRNDHFKYDARQMFVESELCSEVDLLANEGKNDKLSKLQDNVLQRYLGHAADIAKVAVGAGIGTTVALKLNDHSQHGVVLYSTPHGEFCNAAREFFKMNGVMFTDYDVTKDLRRRNEMVTRSGQMGYPVIFVGDEMVVGFDEKKLRRILKL